MSIDYTKVDYHSDLAGFKNDGVLYTGTIDIPTSLTAGEKKIVSATPITIATSPEFCMFFAKFQDYTDLTFSGTGAQWYPGFVGATANVGCTVTAPVGSAGPLNISINPVINGTTVTVQVWVNNPYSNSITIAAQSIPWAFVEFSLAG